jgi:hypothetical protein
MEIWGEIMVNTNISPHFFWYELTLEEVYYLQQSIQNKEKTQWEIMRLHAYNNALPYINDNKKSSLTPSDFMPFPWDKKEIDNKSNKEKLSKEEIQKRIEKYTKINNKKD